MPLNPRMHIRPAEKILEEAISHPANTDGPMLGQIMEFAEEKLIEQRNMRRTIVAMHILALEGPFVLREYKRLTAERGNDKGSSVDYPLFFEPIIWIKKTQEKNIEMAKDNENG